MQPIKHCPCCGLPKPPEVHVAKAFFHSEKFGRMIICLLQHPGEFVTAEKIARAVYCNDPDGGPLDFRNAVNNLYWLHKNKLRDCGFYLQSRVGGVGGYRIANV